MEKDFLTQYYKNLKVSVFKLPEGKEIYPQNFPYHPSENYPEYCFSSAFISSEENYAYKAVRESLRLLGLDKENFGKKSWNPFETLISPGNTVIIKPNLVLDSHKKGGSLYSIITHPSIIRAVIDYCFIALKGRGKIIVADSPQMDCNFKNLLNVTHLEEIKNLYKKEKNFLIEIYDLRNFFVKNKGLDQAYSSLRKKLPGDPMGNIIVNLGEKSEFYNLKNYKNFYGSDYNRQETIKHHTYEIQEYSISKTVLSADTIISLPKLKTHKKAGVSLNAKNFVGINTNKNYLVHYTLGSPSEGGDQFPDTLEGKEKFLIKSQRFAFDKFLAKKSKIGDLGYKIALNIYKHFLKLFGIKLDPQNKIVDEGNWYGNDTTWRMVVDLMKIVYFADLNGNLHQNPQRKIFSLIDGIIGGEKNGPLAPQAKQSGIIISGFNPIAVDLEAINLMGFNWEKLKTYTNLLQNHYFDFYIHNPSEIELISNLGIKNYNLNFIPPIKWEEILKR